ncbi:MAG TPA: response regulator [Phenylobacterium sp.]|jgi:two-component system CheB/CheR fusion protein
MDANSPSRPTVVIVDDDAGLRKALSFLLEVEGLDVISCATGEALISLPLPEGPGCLVLDQHLPGMSGIEALEILRGRGVEIRTIVITSAPDAALRKRALLANARLIEKPLLSDLLLETIKGEL